MTDATRIIGQYSYLVVDDDRFTCDCLFKLLKKLGAAEVKALCDSKEASRWFSSALVSNQLPDIIICDLNMPGMDGVEYMMYLTEKKFTGGIILMSGTAVELLKIVKSLASAHRLNVLGTLSKPISPEELVGMVAQLGQDYSEARA